MRKTPRNRAPQIFWAASDLQWPVRSAENFAPSSAPPLRIICTTAIAVARRRRAAVITFTSPSTRRADDTAPLDPADPHGPFRHHRRHPGRAD
jgi:hypothetical protein